MRVTCMQENLARGLAIVNRAVASRTTLPILSNILIQTEESRLRLSATNLEIGINCWIGAKVETGGAITVPARLLTDFVNSLPTEKVQLEQKNGHTLSVTAEAYQAEIKGIDAADFPVLPTVDEGTRLVIGADELSSMIDQVSIAAASDESRPILTGVKAILDRDAGRVTMAAADGFRLSVRHEEFEVPVEGRLEVIVPARALQELTRVRGADDDTVKIAITEANNQILFQLKDVDLVSQLIDGAFPDYDKIVPSGYATRAVVNTKSLQSAVRVASFFARDAANIVRLAVEPGSDPEPGTVVVSANAAEVGGNQTSIEASIEGEGLEIAFNAKYLIDVLGVAGSDQVALELTDANSPCVFRPVSEVDYTHIVMPMHLAQ